MPIRREYLHGIRPDRGAKDDLNGAYSDTRKSSLKMLNGMVGPARGIEICPQTQAGLELQSNKVASSRQCESRLQVGTRIDAIFGVQIFACHSLKCRAWQLRGASPIRFNCWLRHLTVLATLSVEGCNPYPAPITAATLRNGPGIATAFAYTYKRTKLSNFLRNGA